jgi:hypothetical protein
MKTNLLSPAYFINYTSSRCRLEPICGRSSELCKLSCNGRILDSSRVVIQPCGTKTGATAMKLDSLH